ncbi:TPR repeat protein [Deinococcus enclensis]|uniref:TPR repeat protein n=2 Tax=Deinococcus enclensis TaxID=1049582 RepID=A0ABT9MF10_9DEIO|nr:TPR repeat protein [Deinococcus enclensis]
MLTAPQTLPGPGRAVTYHPGMPSPTRKGLQKRLRGQRLRAAALLTLLSLSTGQADMYEGMELYRAGNIEAALQEFAAAAEGGDPEARLYLAVHQLTGQGIKQDPAAALRVLREAESAGEPEATGMIAWAHQYGVGVPKDLPRALEGYRRAAEAGSVSAMVVLGNAYADGTLGLPKDPVQAVKWYARAAASPVPDYLFSSRPDHAMMRLARLYSAGGAPGGKADPAQAFVWYQKAAEARNPGGLLTAAYLMIYGIGTPKNSSGATRFLDLLAELDPRYRDVPTRLITNMQKEVEFTQSADALVTMVSQSRDAINAHIQRGNAGGGRAEYSKAYNLALKASEEIFTSINRAGRIMGEYSQLSDVVGIPRAQAEYTKPLARFVEILSDRHSELGQIMDKLLRFI